MRLWEAVCGVYVCEAVCEAVCGVCEAVGGCVWGGVCVGGVCVR